MSHRQDRPMFRFSLFAAASIVTLLTVASPAYAGPICGEDPFDVSEGFQSSGTICRTFLASADPVSASYIFDFGTGFEHVLRITIDEVLEDFGIRIQRNLLEAGTSFPGSPDSVCVAYGLGGSCVEYLALDGPDMSLYAGSITWLIAWEQPIGTSPTPGILHDQDFDGTYDAVLATGFFSGILGPGDFRCDALYYDTCGPDDPFVGAGESVIGDPAVGAVSTTFGRVAVVQSVPEPSTLALLTIALGAISARRRLGRR